MRYIRISYSLVRTFRRVWFTEGAGGYVRCWEEGGVKLTLEE